MKHIIIAVFLAGPALAQDENRTGSPVPPTTLTITFENLQLNLENGTIEVTTNQGDLQRILENLPANATIVTPDGDTDLTDIQGEQPDG